MMAAVTWIEVIWFVFCDLKATTCTSEANIIAAEEEETEEVEETDGETADTAFILGSLC